MNQYKLFNTEFHGVIIHGVTRSHNKNFVLLREINSFLLCV